MFLVLSTFLLSFALNADDSCCRPGATPYFSIRSQGLDTARGLVGLTHFINLDRDCFYGTVSVTPEYTRSFRSSDIVKCLFGCDIGTKDCPTLHITGSRVPNRGACDWLADYFGLPTDFESVVRFEPKVQNFIADFDLYLGLENWVHGLYFRIHAPAVRTRWKLGFCESVQNAGSNGYDAGYFNISGVDRTDLLNSFTEFITGVGAPRIQDQGSPVRFDTLSASRFSCDTLTSGGLADLRFALGWNFYQNCNSHLGLNLQFAAPTGTRPDACHVFEPIVGNGHHWEFGGGLSAHWVLWESDCNDRELGIYFEGQFTHLFKARQRRSFDLCNGPNSRYMLAEKLTSDVQGGLAGVNANGIMIPAEAQFDRFVQPVANLTTFDVNVSAGFQTDLTFMLNYTCCDWQWDIGYNFWHRSCEKIKFRKDCCLPFKENEWAVKGDSHVYGFAFGEFSSNSVALSATQHCASVNSGKNFVPGVSIDVARGNPNVDNALTGTSTFGPLSSVSPFDSTLTSSTSIQPVFINTCNVDLKGAETKGTSHKIFTNFSHTWSDHCWVPYLGVGAKAEFASHRSEKGSCDETSCCPTFCGPATASSVDSCDDQCSTDLSCSGCSIQSCESSCSVNSSCCKVKCRPCALSEWGIWVKGGFSFD